MTHTGSNPPCQPELGITFLEATIFQEGAREMRVLFVLMDKTRNERWNKQE